jgi:hypothetical protein
MVEASGPPPSRRDADDAARTSAASSDDRKIARLLRELEALREEFEALRSDLAREVRTARLVVLDDDGAERIATTVTGSASVVEILGPERGPGEPAHIALAASSGDNTWPTGDEVSRAELILSAGDDAFSVLEHVQLDGEHGLTGAGGLHHVTKLSAGGRERALLTTRQPLSGPFGGQVRR